MAKTDKAHSLNPRNKNLSVYENVKTNTIINHETGEIISEQTIAEISRKTSTEPDFIKIYYGTMLAFQETYNIPIQFLIALSSYIEWSNDGKPMYITLNKRVKENLEKNCNVKSAQIQRYIRACIDNNILMHTEWRGVYEVNPFMIAKGKWESIQNLQCQFSFKDNKWVRNITYESKTEEYIQLDIEGNDSQVIQLDTTNKTSKTTEVENKPATKTKRGRPKGSKNKPKTAEQKKA